MPLGRHFYRKKSVQAFYAYVLRVAVSRRALYEKEHTPEETTDSDIRQQATQDARLALEQASPSALASTPMAASAPPHPSSKAYDRFYKETLFQHQKRITRDADHAKQLYEELLSALIKGIHAWLGVYDSLYARSKARGGRLGQSLWFAARAAETRPTQEALLPDSLPESLPNSPSRPPPELLVACCDGWLKERDEAQAVMPTRDEDARYVAKMLRGRWEKDSSLQQHLQSIDPCWSEHKADILPVLVKQIQADIKYKASVLHQGLASRIFVPDAVLFGKQLLAHAITQYPVWIEKIIPVVENWEFSRIHLIDRVLMALALSESASPFLIPTPVILNEYIELAKMYAGPKSPAFINGVLEVLLAGKKK